MSNQLSQQLDLWATENGLSQWGVASLHKPVSLEFYKTWVEKKYFAEMEYLRTHLPIKENPRLLNARIETAIVFSHPYLPHPEPTPSGAARTALYAQGADYHFWLREKLERIAQSLRTLFPEEIFLSYTDSSPILERDLAYRAGLGWVGKNTCLIQPQKGSFFLIGEIATSLALKETLTPVHDFCGSCTRCIDICPTQALESPRLLNAEKCISYLTIESRESPPLPLRKSIGDHFFGCDLCQTICPWNQKVFGKALEIQPRRELSLDDREALILELREILTLSGKKLQKLFAETALMRAGPFGLRRNALIVAANQGLTELMGEISSLQSHSQLGELAGWARAQLEITLGLKTP